MKTTFWHPTFQDCTVISNGITEENKKSPHMMPVTAESLYEWSKLKTAYGIYIEGILVWFIKVMPLWNNIYEWWSLFVLEQYRGQWLSNQLIEHILSAHNDKALLCVTNVLQVKQACKKFKQTEVYRNKIKGDVLNLIESGQALLIDDHVFWNQKFLETAKL